MLPFTYARQAGQVGQTNFRVYRDGFAGCAHRKQVGDGLRGFSCMDRGLGSRVAREPG